MGGTLVPQASVGTCDEGKRKGKGPWLLMATAQGLCKRVSLSKFVVKGRGGFGMIGIKLNEGDALMSLHVVHEHEVQEGDCVVATGGGKVMRTPVKGIMAKGREAKGSQVVALGKDDSLCWITPCRYRHFAS